MRLIKLFANLSLTLALLGSGVIVVRASLDQQAIDNQQSRLATKRMTAMIKADGEFVAMQNRRVGGDEAAMIAQKIDQKILMPVGMTMDHPDLRKEFGWGREEVNTLVIAANKKDMEIAFSRLRTVNDYAEALRIQDEIGRKSYRFGIRPEDVGTTKEKIEEIIASLEDRSMRAERVWVTPRPSTKPR